jgi:ABC-type antimicrobial peptide transport system permease subunit
VRSVDVLQLAVTGLRQNKMRTGLTTVGVTVGVFALTTIVAIGQGLEKTIIDQLTDDESQTRLVIRPGFGPMQDRSAEITGVTDPDKVDRLRKAITKRRRGGPSQRKRTLLAVDAIAAIASRAHVLSVRPLAIDRFEFTLGGEHPKEAGLSFGIEPAEWNGRIVLGEKLTPTSRGVWLHEYTLYRWGYKTDEQIKAILGKPLHLSRPDESGGLNTMITGLQASGIQVPEGAEKMAQQWLKAYAGRGGGSVEVDDAGQLTNMLPLLGVIRERVEADGFEVWEDSFSMQADMFLPQELAEELFEQVPSNMSRGYQVVAIEIDSMENVRAVEDNLRKAGYRTVSIDTILERVARILAIITAVVFGLTAIALIVATLGIVNTMVMNVSERTKEIGILKALGATNGQVRALFLVESGLIGLIGGVTGVAISLLASIPGDYYNQQAIKDATDYSFDGSIFHFPGWLLAIAMSFALVLSVLAALGPASRASLVDPVTALRDE